MPGRVGVGMDDAAGSQASKVFPVGKPAALRRDTSIDGAREAASSAKSALTTSTGSQRCAQAVAIGFGASARAWRIFSDRIRASGSAGIGGAAVRMVVRAHRPSSAVVFSAGLPVAAEASVPLGRGNRPAVGFRVGFSSRNRWLHDASGSRLIFVCAAVNCWEPPFGRLARIGLDVARFYSKATLN